MQGTSDPVDSLIDNTRNLLSAIFMGTGFEFSDRVIAAADDLSALISVLDPSSRARDNLDLIVDRLAAAGIL